MRVLVTGACGFVGAYALTELTAAGHEVLASDISAAASYPLDICDRAAVAALVSQQQPDAILHLAGMAFVPDAKSNPRRAFQLNVDGTLCILDAVREHAAQCRVLVVTSGEVYGGHEGDAAITEDMPLRPVNLYAITKAAADQASLQMAADHGLAVMTARPQNHMGPGQSPRFVSTGFATQIAAQARGEVSEPMLRGNLESVKNFTDVRDVARAYRLLLESGQAGQAYNIASERRVQIGELLELLYDIAGIAPNHVKHEPFFRPTEAAPAVSIERIRSHVGWTPEIPLRQTLADLYASIGG